MTHLLRRTIMVLAAGQLGLTAARAGAIKPDTYFQVASLMKSEAEATENESFKERMMAQAADLYWKCAEEAPADMAENALQLAGTCLFLAGDEESLARAMTATLLITEGFPKGKFAAQALLLQGEIYSAKRAWGRAIKAWNRIASDYAATPAAPEAIFKSGQVFETRIKNLEEARKAYNNVLDKYPQSEFADDSLLARANMQEEANQFEPAVTDFLLLENKYPGSPLADQALYRATSVCESRLKDLARAFELATEFKKKFPHSEYLKKIEAIEGRTIKYAR